MKKQLRKLMGSILILSILLSLFVPVSFAAQTMNEIEICTRLGIIAGESGGVTAEYLSKNTRKFQAAIFSLRIRGKQYEEMALQYPPDNNFLDADQLTWSPAKNVLAFLKANGEFGWAGDNQGNFNPNVDTTPQMYYRILLEILGYTTDVGQGGDFTWSEVLDFAESVGMDKVAGLPVLTNWDIAIATVEALRAKVNGSDMTLAEKLVEEGAISRSVAIETGLIEEGPTVSKAEDVDLGTVDVGDTVELPDKVVVTYSDGRTGEAPVVWSSLLDTAEEGLKTVSGTVEGTKVPVIAWVHVVAVPLQAESLEVDSAKQLHISFTKELNIAEAESIGNYLVTAGESKVSISHVSLSSDRKTVTLILHSNLEPSTACSVTVSKRLGLEQDTTLHGVFSGDAIPPTVKAIEAFGDKLVRVTYNEPVLNAGSIQSYLIDGQQYAGTVQAYGNAYLLLLQESLAVGEHTLTLGTGIADMVGNKPENTSYSFSVIKEDVRPEVQLISCTQTTLKIRFSEPVEPVVKSKIYTRPLAYISSVTAAPDMQSYTIEFNDTKPLDSAGVDLNLVAVTDQWGNKAVLKLHVAPLEDTQAPEVVGYEVLGQNKILLEFSEEVANTGASYELIDSSGVSVLLDSARWFVNDAGVVFKNKLLIGKKDGSVFATGSYTLKLSEVSDLSPSANKLTDYSASIEVTDQLKPEIVGIKRKEQRLIVEFNEKVDGTTVTATDNYSYIDNAFVPRALPKGTQIDFGADGKILTVEFPAGFDMNSIYAFSVSNVKDETGNTMDAKGILSKDFETITAAPYIGLVSIIGKNTIRMTVGTEIDNVTLFAGDFIVKSGNISLTVLNANYDKKSGAIVLTMQEDFSANGTYQGNPVTVQTVKQPLTTDIYGQRLISLAAVNAADKYAPVALRLDVRKNGLNTDVIILLSDNLRTANGHGKPLVSDTSELGQFFVIVDGEVKLPALSKYEDASASMPSRITLTLYGDLTGADIRVKFISTPLNKLTDMANNSLASFELP